MRIIALVLFGLVFVLAALLYNGQPESVPLPRPRPVVGMSGQYETRLADLEKNVKCLRDLVYTEARGEPLEGQYLVAWVAWQRYLDNRPDFGRGSLCDVVYKQTKTKKGFVSQFAGPVRNPVPPAVQSHALRQAFYVAWRVVAGQYVAPEQYKLARYFYNPKTSDASGQQWHAALIPVVTIGRHTFSRE